VCVCEIHEIATLLSWEPGEGVRAHVMLLKVGLQLVTITRGRHHEQIARLIPHRIMMESLKLQRQHKQLFPDLSCPSVRRSAPRFRFSNLNSR